MFYSLILFSHLKKKKQKKPVVRFKLAFLVESSSLNLQLKTIQLNNRLPGINGN